MGNKQTKKLHFEKKKMLLKGSHHPKFCPDVVEREVITQNFEQIYGQKEVITLNIVKMLLKGKSSP